MVPPGEERIGTPTFGSERDPSPDGRERDIADAYIPSTLFKKPITIQVTHLRNLIVDNAQKENQCSSAISSSQDNISIADTVTPTKSHFSDEDISDDDENNCLSTEPYPIDVSTPLNLPYQDGLVEERRGFIQHSLLMRKRMRSLRAFKPRLIRSTTAAINYSPFWAGSHIDDYIGPPQFYSLENDDKYPYPFPIRQMFDIGDTLTEFEQSMLQAYENYIRENKSLKTLLRRTMFLTERRRRSAPKRKSDTAFKDDQVRRYILRFLQANLFSIEDTADHIECVCEWLSLSGYPALLTKTMYPLLSLGGARIMGYDKAFRPILVCRMQELASISENNVLLLLAYHMFFFRSSLMIRGKVEQMQVIVDCNNSNELFKGCWKILRIEAIFPYFVHKFHFVNVPCNTELSIAKLRDEIIINSPTQVRVCLLELERVERLCISSNTESLLNVIDEEQLTEQFGGLRANATESEWLNSHIPISFHCTCKDGAQERHYLGDIVYVGRLNYRCGSGLIPPYQCDHSTEDPSSKTAGCMKDLELVDKWVKMEYGELVESNLLGSEEVRRHCIVATHKLQAEDAIKRYIRDYINISIKVWSLSALVNKELALSSSLYWHGRDVNNRPILMADVQSLIEKAAHSTSQLIEYIVYWINFGLTYLTARCCNENSGLFTVVADFRDTTIETPPALSKALSLCHNFFPNMMHRCIIINCNFRVRLAIETFLSTFRQRLVYSDNTTSEL